ncbi:MAG: TolC family protein [Pseudomonadales bacterium]|nr:TolC family protein [Pseudomonadales bacterium]
MANHLICRAIFISALLATPALSGEGSSSPSLSLSNAIHTALNSDPWLVGSLHKQKGLMAKAVAADSLPDPKINLGITNLASDSFEFKQEPMTQLKLGISQMLPRGNSRVLKKQRFTELAQALPHQRNNRRAQLALQVSQSWLDTYKAQESLFLIVENRPLFEQLVDIAQSKYTSTVGRTRQQDVVRAQLELTRLDDRATRLKQQQEMGLARLFQWLADKHSLVDRTHTDSMVRPFTPHLDRKLPSLERSKTKTATNAYEILLIHPAVLALEKYISASQAEIELAEQQYKPQFGLNATYGYRDDAPNGIERTDFVSSG